MLRQEAMQDAVGAMCHALILFDIIKQNKSAGDEGAFLQEKRKQQFKSTVSLILSEPKAQHNSHSSHNSHSFLL